MDDLAHALADFGPWVVAVVWNVIFVVGAVVGVLWFVIEKVTGRSIRPSVTFFVAWLLFSSFWAWHDEHDRMIIYQTPLGRLSLSYVVPEPSIKGFRTISWVAVSNPGAPSGFHRFGESVSINGRMVEGAIGTVLHQEWIQTCGYKMMIKTDDDIVNRAFPKALQSGDTVEGALIAWFANQPIPRAPVVMDISFEDIHDNVYHFEGITSERIHVLPSNVPMPHPPGAVIVFQPQTHCKSP